MIFTERIQKAINLSANLHKHQTRKCSWLPYVVHPYSVAFILLEYIDDEKTIVWALLHDVIEDVEWYKYDNLKDDFWEDIANLVMEISEERDPCKSNWSTNWKERKDKYLEHLSAASKEAMFICIADKIHNIWCLIHDLGNQWCLIWNKFNASPFDKIWYFEKVYEIVSKRLKNPIVWVFKKKLDRVKSMFDAWSSCDCSFC